MRTMKRRTCALLSLLAGAGCGGGSSGAAGKDAIVAVDTASAEQCPGGGVVVRTGLDANGDGALQEGEVQDETLLCEATAGEPGAPGDDAACSGREPVVVSSAGVVEAGPYVRGVPYTLRVEAAGDDVAFTVVSTEAQASAFTDVGDSAYEAAISFDAVGARAIAVVAYDGCTLDVATVALPIVSVIELGVGYRSACAIVDPPSRLRCWGHEGIADSAPAGENFVQVALSRGGLSPHACALRSGGSIVCWGNDTAGSVEDANEATGTYSEVAVQATATCGVRESDGTLECWGADAWYGRADALDHEGPLSGIAMAPEYWQRTCALEADQGLVCWDSGLDTNGAVSAPNGSTEAYSKVVTTTGSTCARRTGGELDCWGSEVVLDGEVVRDVGALTSGICIVRESGTLACDTESSEVNDNLPSGDGFREVEGGNDFACALHETGKILCWGENGYGQLDLPAELALLP